MLQSYEWIGVAGVVAGIYPYARVQWRRDYAKSWSFSLFNFLNGLLLEISLLHDWNLASFVGNAVWIAISLYGLYRCLRYRRRMTKEGGGKEHERLLFPSIPVAPGGVKG
jgi:hypothetical protein